MQIEHNTLKTKYESLQLKYNLQQKSMKNFQKGKTKINELSQDLYQNNIGVMENMLQESKSTNVNNEHRIRDLE